MLRRLLAALRPAGAPRSQDAQADGTPGSLTIRAAEPRDMPALAAMIAALAAHHGEHASARSENLALALFDRGARSRLAVFVAIRHPDRTLVGYAFVGRAFDPTDGLAVAHLMHLYVVPDERRWGIGSALLAAAREQAEIWRCRALRIATTTENVAAQQFYEAHGFTGRRWEGVEFRVTL
jgi:GNAT superfamily N-acetyltransferase